MWSPIVRRSYAVYYCITGVDINNILNRIARQEVTYLGTGPLNIYKKIKDGVAISKETPDRIKKAFLRQQPNFKQPGRILRSNPSS
jgi:hypothetical protein